MSAPGSSRVRGAPAPQHACSSSNDLSNGQLAALRAAAALEDSLPLPDLRFEGAPDYIEGFALEAVYLDHVPHEQRASYLQQRRDDEQTWRAMKDTIMTMQDDLQQLNEQQSACRAPSVAQGACRSSESGPPKVQLGWSLCEDRPPLE